MAYFIKQHSQFWAGMGMGLLIGFGGSVLYLRFSNLTLADKMDILSVTIGTLGQEVSELKEKLSQKKRRTPAFYSGTHSSSGETDDDDYEDAYGGSSDYEFHNFHDLQTEIHTQMNTRIGKETQYEDRSEKLPKSDEIEAIFKEVDQLVDGSDEDKLKAYDILLNNKSKYGSSVEFCWRLAKSTYQVSQIEGSRGNADRKKELVYASKELSHQAVAMDDKCANAHKWYAITLGSMGDYESTQNKIKNGYTFKEHIECAIKLNPEDPSNHHLLGRWCFGVYMLSWIERNAAAALFATPPTSTAEEALENFLEADRLRPGKWKENCLFIGKCYIQMSKYKDAKEWLKKGSEIPVISQDDKQSEEEIQSLLKKYSTY